jgi:uncharacterized protein YkwD
MLSARSSIFKMAAIAVAVIGAWTFTPSLRASSYSPADEASSRALVNSARSVAGLHALADNAGLDQVAREQAAGMAARDGIYHNPDLKSDADAAGVNWELIGENVGVGPDVDAVHDGFMASPGHHYNIVYPDYNAIGVGVVSGTDGSVFVAHVFAKIAGVAATAAPVASRSSARSVSREPVAAPVVVAPATAEHTPMVKTAEPASPVPNAVVGGVIDHNFVA